MSHPLCPHGNYDTTCPICEKTWDEQDPLAPRDPPWHEKQGVTPAAPPHTQAEEEPEPEPEPTLCSSCRNPLDDKGRCDNLVCASKFKNKTASSAPLPGDQMPKSMSSPSPFTFGQAVMEPVACPLYDSVVINGPCPNGYFRLFTDTAGKRNADISPHIGSGGQLYAPKVFIAQGLRFALTPTNYYHDGQRESYDRNQLLRNTMIEFTIGVRYYYQGPLLTLPASFQKHPLTIPSQQCFYANVEISGVNSLDTDWQIMLILDGELGQPVN
jgi:hypothetical protein